MWAHRIAYALADRGLTMPALLIAYAARAVTGIEIHPRAQIGNAVFIDHGAGVVIGETAIIEDEAMLYHNVTVGSVGWWRPRQIGDRRHPHIARQAVLCTGSLILGPVRVGERAIVGAHAVVLADVPDDTRVPASGRWEQGHPTHVAEGDAAHESDASIEYHI